MEPSTDPAGPQPSNTANAADASPTGTAGEAGEIDLPTLYMVAAICNDLTSKVAKLIDETDEYDHTTPLPHHLAEVLDVEPLGDMVLSALPPDRKDQFKALLPDVARLSGNAADDNAADTDRGPRRGEAAPTLGQVHLVLSKIDTFAQVVGSLSMQGIINGDHDNPSQTMARMRGRVAGADDRQPGHYL